MNVKCGKCEQDVSYLRAAVFGYHDDTQEWICEECQLELKDKLDLALKEYLGK
jgi:hypothetical protein